MHNKIPNHILRIEDLTFVLSDDFTGDFIDALEELLEYSKERLPHRIYINDDASTIPNALESESRLCMKYGLFTNRDGSYNPTEKI